MTIYNADVVIIGTGIAGNHIAFKLAGQGVNVLMLEAGQRISRGDAVEHFVRNTEKGPNSPYPTPDYAPFPQDSNTSTYYIQAGPDEFKGSYTRILGGTTWHWTGFADRLRPADFRMHSNYGVATDWPIDYDLLEPYYREAEHMWGVAGDPEHTWGAPRQTPYPLPPVPPSYMDQVISQVLEPLGLSSAPFSHARNSVPFDDRPPCCGNNTCVPICPIGAKYDGSVHTLKAEKLGAHIIEKALAYQIDVAADKTISGIRFKHPDGSTHQARGRYYVVACHAVENPRLLLLSRGKHSPQGVANSSGLVGRYLVSQYNQNALGITAEPIYPYRGPQQTSGLVQFRDGEFRRDYAAFGTSFMNDGWSGNLGAINTAKDLIKQGLKGGALIQQLRHEVARHLRLNSSAETLPDINNRIEVDFEQLDSAGIPKPKVTFTVDEYTKKGLAKALEVNKKILAALQATDIRWDTPFLSSAIIGGTTRMGNDPKTSVVSAELRAHDHPNLFITGTSTHLTAPVNAPTLTVAANSLRVAEIIQRELQGG